VHAQRTAHPFVHPSVTFLMLLAAVFDCKMRSESGDRRCCTRPMCSPYWHPSHVIVFSVDAHTAQQLMPGIKVPSLSSCCSACLASVCEHSSYSTDSSCCQMPTGRECILAIRYERFLVLLLLGYATAVSWSHFLKMPRQGNHDTYITCVMQCGIVMSSVRDMQVCLCTAAFWKWGCTVLAQIRKSGSNSCSLRLTSVRQVRICSTPLLRQQGHMCMCAFGTCVCDNDFFA
jgi:hypothetical protein